MSRTAWGYVIGVIAIGIAASVFGAIRSAPTGADWLACAALIVCAIASLIFRVVSRSSHTSDEGAAWYSPQLVFLFAGALLLPPSLYTLLVVVPHAVEWAFERIRKTPFLKTWYIQPFNIAGHIVCGLIAGVTTASATSLLRDGVVQGLIAALCGIAAYVLLNHLLVSMALRLARRVSVRDSQLFTLDSLSPDFIMLIHGFVIAELWKLSPVLIVPGLSPLVLIQHAIMVPQLRRQAQTDDKTGLVNAGHFKKLFAAEFDRAVRFDRPLTIMMADLDQFRDLNNTHGHLAGDKVLAYAGGMIRKHLREYDFAGRFGGEEFVIALPETTSETAFAIAESLRCALECAAIEVSPEQTVHATISFGVAQRLDNMTTADELINAADVAVYEAKRAGRNKVVLAPLPIRLNMPRETLSSRHIHVPVSTP